MTANQVHYNSLKTPKWEEYKDDLEARSYAESKLNIIFFSRIDSKYEWKIMDRNKRKRTKVEKNATIL